jgi:hypothetical protein
VQQAEATRGDVAVTECVTPLPGPSALAGYGWLPGTDLVSAETGNRAAGRRDRRRGCAFPAWSAEITSSAYGGRGGEGYVIAAAFAAASCVASLFGSMTAVIA